MRIINCCCRFNKTAAQRKKTSGKQLNEANIPLYTALYGQNSRWAFDQNDRHANGPCAAVDACRHAGYGGSVGQQGQHTVFGADDGVGGLHRHIRQCYCQPDSLCRGAGHHPHPAQKKARKAGLTQTEYGWLYIKQSPGQKLRFYKAV